ncbi:hypothetical protein AQUCO_00200425v1 [Aquilegia coerulea]|uniref:F-box domain-containing protein n=1 Tax=Aquilegia coerulea TaxID=218851 RepID=A0A2G5F321_AQUCA|nr:hypothetical protein AQUCO_00200425v1 [Aquilegia coerulea]
MCEGIRKKPCLRYITTNDKEDIMTTSVDHLPEELIPEILQKLPAKFLIQLKSVCKLWFHQVTNHDFVRAQLQQNSDDQVIIIERICVNPHKHDYYCIQLVQEVKDMQEEKQFKIYCKIKEFFKEQGGDDILLRDSCDGLILLQSKRDGNQFYVCNPLTRHCTKLPLLETSCCIFYLTLVLDESFDQTTTYKVVAICQDSLKCFVLKAGKPSEWKEFNTGYKNSVILSSHSLTLVNKEYHWLRLQDNGKTCCEPYLYSMNAGTEEIRFRETKISSEITCKHDHNSILEIKGSLCLTDSISNFNQIDIWTLHDKDKYNCTWTKNYTIVLDSLFKNPTHVYSFPQSYQQRTVILIQYKNRLLFYDLEKKDSRNFDFPSKDFGEVDIPSNNKKFFTNCQFVHLDSLANWE